jgi:hypothetical protein
VTSDHGCHTSPLLLRATTVTVILVISLRPIATKDNNSYLLISSTLLAEIRIDLDKYLLITQHIEVVTKGTLEILKCSSFCRAYTVVINNLYTPNLGEVMLNSFIVGSLVSDPK